MCSVFFSALISISVDKLFHWLQSLPLPSGAAQDADDSGLRPSKQPPIAIGGTLSYQCPGVKSVIS